ncbi:hypothetical protein GLV94_15855 [Virgibacillus halodenitrificans]|uniref:DUF1640 domain-containing protein n=2 Tax=Virgibacillus halodenitrificans TaxID=1482 RepID=A0AAC9NMD4_VIRHA|nr:hypothetical protein [Virgibacillus halodenitrificans]APC49584.1 hypothetical protein BME96_15895 [Virgibacillus halodenitrificans]MYL47124.1 hypothetical protein [Virgibacillus halodenitrificans]
MEKHELNEVLNALKQYSGEITGKITELETSMSDMKGALESRMDNMKTELENRMDERFDRMEAKLNGSRVELTEIQETVDFLSSKTVQHEKKLRKLLNQ